MMDIEGRNFICPDTNCTDLKVRFGEPPNQAIYVKGTWMNETFVRCKIPKYTKPDVLRVELTLNDEDYTNDGKTYGYFDPYVLNAEPRLISVEGTTIVRIIGFGFVDSGESKSKIDGPNQELICNGQPCVKEAKFIDKQTLETHTFPQATVLYKDSNDNIMWDAMNIDAAVYENDFTENNIDIYYYEEPFYEGPDKSETPGNVPTQLFTKTDFKNNDMDRFKRLANFTCRYKSENGTVKYTKAYMIRYPLEASGGKPNSVQCKTPEWDLGDKPFEKVKFDIAVNGQDFHGNFDFTFT